MEWRLGTQDQLVPALERAVSHSRQAERFTVPKWSVSEQAFGSQGSSRAGVPPHINDFVSPFDSTSPQKDWYQ